MSSCHRTIFMYKFRLYKDVFSLFVRYRFHGNIYKCSAQPRTLENAIKRVKKRSLVEHGV